MHKKSFFTDKTEVEVIKEEEQVSEQKQTKIAIKFEFIMDSFVIDLFTGGSKMVKS